MYFITASTGGILACANIFLGTECYNEIRKLQEQEEVVKVWIKI